MHLIIAINGVLCIIFATFVVGTQKMHVMKKLILTAVFAIAAIASSSGQKLMIGEKAPDLKIKEWLNQGPSQGSVRLNEFFHSADEQSRARLSILDNYANKYSELTVILVAREDKAIVENAVRSSSRSFPIGIDDNGKTFSAYSVQYIPFSVLVDEKGRVIWFGNSSNLQENFISNALK